MHDLQLQRRGDDAWTVLEGLGDRTLDGDGTVSTGCDTATR